MTGVWELTVEPIAIAGSPASGGRNEKALRELQMGVDAKKWDYKLSNAINKIRYGCLV